MYLYNDSEEERDALGFILYYNDRTAKYDYFKLSVWKHVVVDRGACHDIFCWP